MLPLPSELRRDLERAIVSARGHAEAGARAAIARLAVEADPAPVALSAEQRTLRVQLRARGRALGGGSLALGIPLLVEEIAYEQWHRMLFARFLAENGLLLHPEGAPVTLAEVKELADEEGERDMWVLAARYAAAMLPGIFRADDPANRVTFAPEDRSRLEGVLEMLPPSMFTADDALGWVYQFWQSKRKDEVNKRGDKIGGADLPAVTQLFTEHYMVRFLLENSLGAWWAGRHPDSPLLREWEYLRYRDDGIPAAGTFEGWPTRGAEVTVMDPCCGSGHFLVAAADMLRKMRMAEEGLSPAQAAAAVIADNLFGLELDARCLQLAAFNLALDAWKVGGYQPLPIPNLACSGIAIRGQRADWHRLAGDDERMRRALDRLHDLFQEAPDLGSLIDPRSAAGEGLWAVHPDELLGKLDRALARETAKDPAAAVFGAAAAGTARAARLLTGRFWLVATNPPFLGQKKQDSTLAEFIASRLPQAASDLAFALWSRSRSLARDGGHTAFVLPQALLSHPGTSVMRRHTRRTSDIRLVARLGVHAFESIGGTVVSALLLISSSTQSGSGTYAALDVYLEPTPGEKAQRLVTDALSVVRRLDAADKESIALTESGRGIVLLESYVESVTGIILGDAAHWQRYYHELPTIRLGWKKLETAPQLRKFRPIFSGKSSVVWFAENGEHLQSATAVRRMTSGQGVLITRPGYIRASLWAGAPVEQSAGLLKVRDTNGVDPLSWTVSG